MPEAGFHSRGYLPHLKVPGAAYFVTFRLADSLPRSVVANLKARRKDLLARMADEQQSPTDRRRNLHAWYAAEVDAVLDSHSGIAHLRDARVADMVAGALRHFAEVRYRLHAWCLMPNRVHAVVRPASGNALEDILHNWKSFTAHAANAPLGRTGEFWQRESYDHYIRDDADFEHCCSYTEQNPVKAGLCAKAEDWRWSSALP